MSMSEIPVVFNRRAVRLNRDRAAARFAEHDFLFREVAGRLLDRLDDVTRAFPLALDLGCRTGTLRQMLEGRNKVGTLIQCDLSERMVRIAGGGAAADEEALPFAPGTFDLVVSALALHWTNDLPGALVQIRRALKPDGLFLGALFGADTLKELRRALTEAELDVAGGASPRVAPFADVRDLGALLQRAGFALPVVDVDTITVSYADPLRLMRDLRGMGEANAVAARYGRFSRRALFAAAAERYLRTHAGPDGRVPATFQVMFLTAWSPHPDQQRPLKPGSAKTSLARALDPGPKEPRR